jgi:hypothetical protein
VNKGIFARLRRIWINRIPVLYVNGFARFDEQRSIGLPDRALYAVESTLVARPPTDAGARKQQALSQDHRQHIASLSAQGRANADFLRSLRE